jgi:hypothetical protein
LAAVQNGSNLAPINPVGSDSGGLAPRAHGAELHHLIGRLVARAHGLEALEGHGAQAVVDVVLAEPGGFKDSKKRGSLSARASPGGGRQGDRRHAASPYRNLISARCFHARVPCEGYQVFHPCVYHSLLDLDAHDVLEVEDGDHDHQDDPHGHHGARVGEGVRERVQDHRRRGVTALHDK